MDLVKATYKTLKMVGLNCNSSVLIYSDAEVNTLKECQANSFLTELMALHADKPGPPNSRLKAIPPELDNLTGLIRVGGRLRNIPSAQGDLIHPIVLDPSHPVIKLLVKNLP